MRSLIARSLPALLTTTALAGGAALLAHGQGAASAPTPTIGPAKGSVSHVAPTASTAYGKLPLAFEANGGRVDKRIDFMARGAGYSLFLTPGESVLAVRHGKRGAVLRTRLAGASTRHGIAEARLPGKVNSLIGNDPSKWRTGIPTFARVRYASVYPGIDLVYHGRAGRVEYDFSVRPGADPSKIGLDLLGGRSLRLDRNGNLVIRTAAGTLFQPKPVAYQRIHGHRHVVRTSYVVRGHHVGIRVGRYARARALLIDPVLAYSTFIGGNGADEANAIAVDANQNAYIAGDTASTTGFPISGGFDPTLQSTDGFVTELNSSGTAILFSTFIGGTGSDVIHGMTIGSDGTVYIAGETTSTDFPTVRGTYTTNAGGTDGFVARIAPGGGTESFGTYVGGTGTDQAYGIGVDANGALVVAGKTSSTDFPVTTSSSSSVNIGFQTTNGGGNDAFVIRLAPQTGFCHIILGGGFYCPPYFYNAYSTYLGGAGNEGASGVALDGASPQGVYITGTTSSSTAPANGALTKNGAQTTYAGGNSDAFVAKLDPSQTTASNTLVFASYFGGTGDETGNGIAVTGNGLAQIVGSTTTGSNGLPGSPGNEPAPLAYGGGSDGFVTSVSSTGGAFSNTAYIGGNGTDHANAIAITDYTFCRLFIYNFNTHQFSCTLSVTVVSQYVVGDERSSNFPGLANGGVAEAAGSSSSLATNDTQAFALKRIPGTGLIWSIYMGGNSTTADVAQAVGVDSQGKTYLAGRGGYNFPTTSGSFQAASGSPSSTDAFVARLEQKPPSIDSPSPAEGAIVTSSDVTFGFSTTDSGMTYYCSGDPNNQLDNVNTQACAPPMTYSGLADGPQTFGVQTVDAGGARSDPALRHFIVDTTPPTAPTLVAPDDNSTVNSTPTFQWNASTDTATKVSYQILIDGNKNADVPDGSCDGSTGVCSGQAAAIPTGTHTWAIRANDQAGHTADSATRTINVIDPPQARFGASPNPALTGRTVTFDASASNDATHTITDFKWDLDGDGTFETDTGTTPKATKSYDKAGTVHVSLQVTDGSGVTATSSVDLKVLSLSTPAGLLGVTINHGAQWTNDPNVTVSTVFPAGTSQMLFSNDGGFLAPTSFPPQKDTPWTLDVAGPERLPKIVYVRFFIGPLPTETFTDDIILDTIPPVVSQAAVAPAGPAAASARVAVAAKKKLAKWTIKVKAKDSNSGVGGVQATANKKKPGKVYKYKAKLVVKSAKRPQWIRARDRAGNYSKWRKAR